MADSDNTTTGGAADTTAGDASAGTQANPKNTASGTESQNTGPVSGQDATASETAPQAADVSAAVTAATDTLKAAVEDVHAIHQEAGTLTEELLADLKSARDYIENLTSKLLSRL